MAALGGRRRIGRRDRMMLMGGGEREWVTGATVLRAQTAKPGKIYMSSLGLACTTMYQGGNRHPPVGRRKDSGWVYNAYEVDLQRATEK